MIIISRAHAHFRFPITLTSYKHHGVSTPGNSVVCSTDCSAQQHRKMSKLHYLPFVRAIHRWPVDYLHKEPVIRKACPCHDVIMIRHTWLLLILIFCTLGTVYTAPPDTHRLYTGKGLHCSSLCTSSVHWERFTLLLLMHIFCTLGTVYTAPPETHRLYIGNGLHCSSLCTSSVHWERFLLLLLIHILSTLGKVYTASLDTHLL